MPSSLPRCDSYSSKLLITNIYSVYRISTVLTRPLGTTIPQVYSFIHVFVFNDNHNNDVFKGYG